MRGRRRGLTDGATSDAAPTMDSLYAASRRLLPIGAGYVAADEAAASPKPRCFRHWQADTWQAWKDAGPVRAPCSYWQQMIATSDWLGRATITFGDFMSRLGDGLLLAVRS